MFGIIKPHSYLHCIPFSTPMEYILHRRYSSQITKMMNNKSCVRLLRKYSKNTFAESQLRVENSCNVKFALTELLDSNTFTNHHIIHKAKINITFKDFENIIQFKTVEKRNFYRTTTSSHTFLISHISFLFPVPAFATYQTTD
jgi:hypothetical protein